MKEFNKHFLKNYPNVPLTKDDAIFALHIWRAALEWALKLKKIDCSIKDPFNLYFHIDDWGVYEIEKEIRDE